MKITWSKKLIEKFGSVVYGRRNELFVSFLEPTDFNLLDYLIDWQYRKSVNLVNWLSSQIEDEFGNDIVKTNDWKSISDPDKRMIAIQRFIFQNYTYIGDKENYNADEHWATFKESWVDKKKTGDCEDGAIAMLILARKSGIPADQIKLVAGNVLGGGHAFIVYTSQDGNEYVMDWCYYPDTNSLDERDTIWDSPKYYNGTKLWFGVNDLHTYKE